jgi:Fe-S-cluster containining protein
MDPGVEDFPFHFACRRSGNCCSIPGGFVRTTRQEQERLAELLGMTHGAFVARYLQPDGTRLKEGIGHRCVFLRDGTQASCSVYESRPEQCRTWPFWQRMKTDPDLLQLAVRTCPGITLS